MNQCPVCDSTKWRYTIEYIGDSIEWGTQLKPEDCFKGVPSIGVIICNNCEHHIYFGSRFSKELQGWAEENKNYRLIDGMIKKINEPVYTRVIKSKPNITDILSKLSAEDITKLLEEVKGE